MGFCTFFWESKKLHFREILVIQPKYPLLNIHYFYTLLRHLKQSWTKKGKFLKTQAIRWLLLEDICGIVWIVSMPHLGFVKTLPTTGGQRDVFHLHILEYRPTNRKAASAFLCMTGLLYFWCCIHLGYLLWI